MHTRCPLVIINNKNLNKFSMVILLIEKLTETRVYRVSFGFPCVEVLRLIDCGILVLERSLSVGVFFILPINRDRDGFESSTFSEWYSGAVCPRNVRVGQRWCRIRD